MLRPVPEAITRVFQGLTQGLLSVPPAVACSRVSQVTACYLPGQRPHRFEPVSTKGGYLFKIRSKEQFYETTGITISQMTSEVRIIRKLGFIFVGLISVTFPCI